MQNIETSINFGGFYESIHDASIESLIESMYSDGEYPEYNYYNIDYAKTHQSYIEKYCIEFESYISNEYNLDIDFKNIKLWSPREYNFQSDKIDCTITQSENMKLMKHFIKDTDFLTYLKDATVSYDGYHSFYDYRQALDNKNDVFSMYLLEYLANEFNKNEELPYEFEIHLCNEKQLEGAA